MADFDEDQELKRWAKIMNRGHGYAGVFNYQDNHDKRIVELTTLNEWCSSIEVEFGVEISAVEPNPCDPPDFFVSIADYRLGIELVQLVEQAHKERAARDETPYAGQLFMDTQWSRDRFISKLDAVISRKAEKYAKVGINIELLLVYTDEPWLNSNQAREWLKEANIEVHSNIGAVSLLFNYEAGNGAQHWPVFMVYGKLPEMPKDG